MKKASHYLLHSACQNLKGIIEIYSSFGWNPTPFLASSDMVSIEIGQKPDAQTMATLSKIFAEDLQTENSVEN